MAARRTWLLVTLLVLVLICPTNLKLVIAAGQPLRATFVCHDNCWEEAEYCGHDAFFATGEPDMNHDCIVDGLDVALWYADFGSGTGVSGDFDGISGVTAVDLSILASHLGHTAATGHSIPIPVQCEGTISISLNDDDPVTIIDNASQSVGTHTAYVVVSGVTNARAIEFGLTTSANITNVSAPFLAHSGTDYVCIGSGLVTGTDVFLSFTYKLTNTSPATISIAALPAYPWMRNRWTTDGAPASHQFISLNSAGINGSTPASVSPSCSPTGTITGTLHLENDNNCTFNGGDTPVSGRLVTTTPGSYFGLTDASGNYSIAVPAGSYSVSLFSFGGSFSACQISPLPVNVTAGLVSAGNDFALKTLGSTCDDGAWDDGEYCGRDAYTATGKTDMNHDCLVDGLDYALFAQQYGSKAHGLSGDFNGDCIVDVQDRALIDANLGQAVTPCNSTPIPAQCDAALQLSFGTNPSNVITKATQAPGGPYSVWVIVNGVVSAKSVEFWIKASPNVSLGNLTWLGGGTALTQTASYCTSLWGVGVFTPLITGGAAVAKLDYSLTDSNPATISIVPPAPCAAWARNRWAPADGSVSHEFQFVTSVGINGTPPGFTPTCGPLGQITGTVYAEVPTENCTFDGSDTKLLNRVVRADPGPYYAYTDANGNYSFTLAPKTYTVSMDGFNSPWTALSPCQASSTPTYTVPLLANTTSSGNDFALEQSGTITGRVFSDASTPCVFDVGTDVGMAGRQVLATPGNFAAYTDLNGNYSLRVPIGTYTLTLVKPSGDPWAFPSCFAGSYPSVMVTVNTTTTGKDFPLNLAGTACNVTTQIVSNPFNHAPPPCQTRILTGPCSGIEHEYLVWVWGDPYLSNTTLPANSSIIVQLDAAYTINTVTADCSITTTNLNAYTRKVTFTSPIPPGTRCTVKVRATPSGAGPYTETAAFNPGTACIGTLNRTLSEVSRCGSCDPNDMLVQPGCGVDGEVSANEPLTYTARFQNVGQDPAQNIVIEDVLDAHLDPRSLYIVQASHAVTGVQLEAGNKLVIRFNNINLPGTTDPDNSHGYVMFSINQLPGLPDGTTITNTASVFFDFNAPVVTNTALTTVKDNPCAVTPVAQPSFPKTTFLGQNHPNPFNPTTTLEYGLVSFETVSINIYNARGELVRTLVSGRRAPGWYSVDWDGRDQQGNQVASGVYLSRMQAGSFSQTRKLVLLK